MKNIVWEIKYLANPPIVRYCKKCGKKTEYFCSGQFRINAQRKSLDIWLIYKCSNCDTTWNLDIYSRISPKSLKPELLDAFYKNDETIAKQFAMNADLLQKNGAEVKIPPYSIIGEDFSLSEPVTLEIKSKYVFPIKISSVIREKLHLSQKEYAQLVSAGKIKSIPDCDLQKSRLKSRIILIFG